jgi:hypothetical protein
MEKSMSDVNATPEQAPVEPATAAPGEPLTGSTVTSNQSPDTPVTQTVSELTQAADELPNAVAQASAAVSVPVSEVHAALLHVHDALQNVSLTEALNRFYAYAKSIKALAGE